MKEFRKIIHIERNLLPQSNNLTMSMI